MSLHSKTILIGRAAAAIGLRHTDHAAREALTELYEAAWRNGYKAADDNPRQPESMGR